MILSETGDSTGGGGGSTSTTGAELSVTTAAALAITPANIGYRIAILNINELLATGPDMIFFPCRYNYFFKFFKSQPNQKLAKA
jgi:hypothetical protein